MSHPIKLPAHPSSPRAYPREIKCSISLQPGTDCKMRVRRTEEKEKEGEEGRLGTRQM